MKIFRTIGALAILPLLLIAQPNAGARQASAQSELDRLAAESARLRTEGKFRDAVPVLQKMIALLEQGSPRDEDAIADVLNLLGVTCFNARMLNESVAPLERALAIRERLHTRASPQVAQTLNNLANITRALGDPVRAEVLFLEVLGLQEKLRGPDDIEVARVQNNLASLYESRGDFSRAEPMYQHAIAIFEGGGRPASIDLARALNNLGLLYQNRGDLERALPTLERALAIRRKLLPANHPDLARGLANVAANYQERGDLDRAASLSDEALAIYDSGGASESTDAASVLLNKAMILLLRGDYANAAPNYQKALAIRERLLGPSHPDTGAALERLAVFHQSTGRRDEALQAIRRSAEIAEHNLALTIQVGSEEQKTRYMRTLQENTDILLSMRRDFETSDPGFTPLAAAAVIQRQGRVLETLVNATSRLRESLGPSDRKLFDDLAAARSSLAQIVLTAAASPAADRAATIGRLQADIDRLERALASSNSEARIQLRPVTLEDVTAALPAGNVLVEYVKYQPFDPKAIGRFNRFLPPRYAAFVIRAGQPLAWVELGPADRIERAASTWRSSLLSPRSANVNAAGRDVADLLMGPLAAHTKGAKRLYVVPDDALNLLPFGALPARAGRYLVEDTGVAYLASSRDLLKFGSDPPSREPALVIAAPALGSAASTAGAASPLPPFAPLPGAAREGAAVARLIPRSKLVTGSAATEALVKNTHGPVLLHFATHAFFAAPSQAGGAAQTGGESRGLSLTDRISDDPYPLLRAGIVLAGPGRTAPDQEDGVLTALEAASLDLHGTRLVVLSACETGLGEIRAGDGVLGFRRALAIAGAESLVLTLWRVDDASTAQLIADYYRALRNGAGREEALTQAQLAMLHRGAQRHPYYWAAFVLAGDPSPMSFEPTPPGSGSTARATSAGGK